MAITRRQFVVAMLAPALASPLVFSRSARAAIEADTLEEFERILKAGLRARRPEEMRFIAAVVDMVGKGRLPRELVEAAFVWVRRKKYKERYPVVWFERSLRALAAREDITIPPLGNG